MKRKPSSFTCVKPLKSSSHCFHFASFTQTHTYAYNSHLIQLENHRINYRHSLRLPLITSMTCSTTTQTKLLVIACTKGRNQCQSKARKTKNEREEKETQALKFNFKYANLNAKQGIQVLKELNERTTQKKNHRIGEKAQLLVSTDYFVHNISTSFQIDTQFFFVFLLPKQIVR